MKKNPRRMTFEESGETLIPYKSLPNKSVKCVEHAFEIKKDKWEHKWFQCSVCGLNKK